MKTLRFEFRENGSPKLVTETGKESEPVSYQGIATITVGEKIYIGFGEYYNGHGKIESGKVYRLAEQSESGIL